MRKISLNKAFNFQNGDKILNVILDAIQPPTSLTVSEWADEYRVMSPETSNEPGPWRTIRTPYLKEIMDCLSVDSDYTHIAVMKSGQIGLTEAGNNWLGYIIDVAPATTLMLMPSQALIDTTNIQKIEPMFNSCPTLKEKLIKNKGKDRADTKRFPGGRLFLKTAGSAKNVSSLSAKYIFIDEADRMLSNVDGEGDPIALAETRADSFGDSKKIFIPSTPTVKGVSVIEREFKKGDRRYYFVPCPHCGEMQTLVWENLKYEVVEDRIVSDPKYKCCACGKLIEERYKTQMLENGEWRATAKPKTLRRVSFHINALYSPYGWHSWRNMAEGFIESKDKEEMLIQFFNTKLGLSYELKGDAPPWRLIYEQREDFQLRKVPAKALFLTAGVDVQPDRLECHVVAWAKDKQFWSIDYEVLWGNPDEPEVWEKLEEILNREFEHENGSFMEISVMAPDTGGRNTQSVYQWCLKQQRDVGYGRKGAFVLGSRNIMPIKGRDIRDTFVPAPNRIEVNGVKNALRLWTVGSSALKAEIYSCLKIERPTDKQLAEGKDFKPRTGHFPKDYDEEFFKQLTSERQVIQNTKSGTKVVWLKDSTTNNEVLDTLAYARAAAHVMGLDNPNKNWSYLENELSKEEQTEQSKARDEQRIKDILSEFNTKESFI